MLALPMMIAGCATPFQWGLHVVVVDLLLFAVAFPWFLSFALVVLFAPPLADCFWWPLPLGIDCGAGFAWLPGWPAWLPAWLPWLSCIVLPFPVMSFLWPCLLHI